MKSEFFRQITKFVFLPFILEILLFNVYCFVIANEDKTDLPSAWDVTGLEFYLRHAVLAFAVFFAYIEWLQALYAGLKDYFRDIYNYVNVIGIALRIYVVFVYGYNLDRNRNNMYIYLSIAVFFTWLNALFWIRFFESMSHYFHMIIVTF